MSGLFSLNSILNENNTFKSIIKTPVNETYLNSALPILEKFNAGIEEHTKIMYEGISEATSRSEENEKFAEYFKNYKSLVNDYIREMNELVSRFAINVGTYIDANKSIIDNSSSMSIAGEPSIKVYDFENLDNDKVPNINVEKAFKKEFKFIGKMMQDLGNAITDDETKANVLATVCNNLADEIQDGWLEKCMCKIADLDDDEENCKKTNFASVMYKKFIPNNLRDMNITSGDIQQARLALMNSSALVDGIEKANNEFSSGLEKVSCEIGAMFFRNQDCKMPIKTDEEGIADRDYKLNPASFNQFNIFMANKCTQITELCNLYIIAVGIKADMIYKYLKQCVDIIETAMNGVDYTPNDDNIDDEDIQNQETSDDDDPVVDDNEDEVGRSMEFNEKIPDGDQGSDGIDDNSNSDFEDSDKENESKSELDEASYLFESVLFDMERAYNKLYFSEQMSQLLEADNIPLQKDEDGKTVDMRANAGKIIAGDPEKQTQSKVISFIKQLQELLSKFIKAFTDSIGPAVDNIRRNGYANKLKNITPPDGWTIDFVDTVKLLNIHVQPMNIKGDGDLLDDQNKYIEAKWKSVLGEGKNPRDRIYNALVKTNIPYTATERDAGIEYLLNYKTNMDKLEQDKKTLESEQRKIKQALNEASSISSMEEAMLMYFAEKDNMSATNDQNQQNSQTNTNTTNQSTNNQNNTLM